ncbi:MAG: sodium-dependent transporter [Magnetovibrio sp.]|nr:sodium-dependent transporter [Magnetovibrio sp.]
MDGHRGEFASRLGFILAAAGSAIGLGNIWKFPYVAGANGGGAFLLLYLGMVFTIGLSVMLAELAIGRAARLNPVGAFAKLKGGAWVGVGYMGVIAGFVILSFYSVVGGWTLAYTLYSLGPLMEITEPERLGAFFTGFIANPVSPLFYHGMFMAMTMFVVVGGVEKGIERAGRLLMPLLLGLLVLLTARAVTLPGAGAGLAFFLTPDFSKIDGATVTAALGQAFFSLSLGMGALLTYGSYLSRRENLASSALWVTSLDTVIAVSAGFLILPAVFAFGFDPAVGPGLTFITLPAVFAQMPLGALFAPLFFGLLTIAALTSAVSLLETVVAYLVDQLGFARRRATVLFGVAIFALGVPSALSFGPLRGVTIAGRSFFDAMDYLASNLMLPLGGIAIAVFAGWVVRERLLDEITASGAHRVAGLAVWIWICRLAAPLAIAWILITGL